jgi:hypothetical protein
VKIALALMTTAFTMIMGIAIAGPMVLAQI